MTDRGQLYTLEGIFAGLVILLGIFFAIQATTTTPSAAGASGPHATLDDDVYVQDILSSTNRSTLKEAVLYWESQSNGFHCSPDETYYTGFYDCPSGTTVDEPTGTDHPPPNTFGHLLEQRLGDQYTYNVRVAYHTTSGMEYERMVYQGEPGVGAVRSSTSVILLNDDELRTPGGTESGTTLRADWDGPSEYFAPPSDGAVDDGDAYNVVHVEVVIWRG